MTKARPIRIVQTITGSGTTNYGDTLVDENGNRWRLLSPDESVYYDNSSQTVAPVIKIIRNGKFCDRW